MAQLPKRGLVKGHDKPEHGSCAIYFPRGIGILIKVKKPLSWIVCHLQEAQALGPCKIRSYAHTVNLHL